MPSIAQSPAALVVDAQTNFQPPDGRCASSAPFLGLRTIARYPVVAGAAKGEQGLERRGAASGRGADGAPESRSPRRGRADPAVPEASATRHRCTAAGFLGFRSGAPCRKGPWATLVAVDLDVAEVLWERPVGTTPWVDVGPEAARWGYLTKGGPMVTDGGVVFLATKSSFAPRTSCTRPKSHGSQSRRGRPCPGTTQGSGEVPRSKGITNQRFAPSHEAQRRTRSSGCLAGSST